MTEIVIPYTPRPVQWQLHELAERVRFLVVCCHRQLGKTTFAINECIQTALFCQKLRPRALYLAPYRYQAKNVVWDALKHFTRDLPGVAYNEAELRADFTNGGRVMLGGADNADALRGLSLDLVVLDDPAFMAPDVFSSIIRPMLAARQGRAIFIGTPYGSQNHFKALFDAADRPPEWGRVRIPASESEVLSAEELASARASMAPPEYDREFECSWTAVVEGTIYGRILEQLERDGRIGHVPFRPGVDVDTGWDLGVRDATAIWFVQKVGPATHLIDYVQESGAGIEYYIGLLKDRAKACGYHYGRHYVPHDAAASNIQTGKSLVDVASEAGLWLDVVQRGDVATGINHVRTLLAQAWIDKTKCAEGLRSLQKYRYSWNEALGAFSLKPQHDAHSHAADALRSYAVGYQDIPDESEIGDLKTDLRFDPFNYEKQNHDLDFSPWRR